MNARILIVEDDPALTVLLQDNLEYEGYTVDIATDVAEATAKARANPPDLMLLDLMLPDGDSFEVCRTVASMLPQVSIVILTSRQSQVDKIKGLDLGADDYVTKPCGVEELLARIRAVMRRTRPSVSRLQLGETTIDFVSRKAFRQQTEVALTMREFELLQYLAEHAGRIATREELLKMVWGYEQTTLTRTIDNFVARLRRKIEVDAKHPKHILTAHGGGYCLVP